MHPYTLMHPYMFYLISFWAICIAIGVAVFFLWKRNEKFSWKKLILLCIHFLISGVAISFIAVMLYDRYTTESVSSSEWEKVADIIPIKIDGKSCWFGEANMDGRNHYIYYYRSGGQVRSGLVPVDSTTVIKADPIEDPRVERKSTTNTTSHGDWLSIDDEEETTETNDYRVYIPLE